ncbi:hypothetical protein OG937_45980 [Streptomyces sp. NBC_00510]
MASIGWYVKKLSLGLGAMGVLIAWDRYDQGPAAADDPAGNAAGDVGLYSWVGFTTGEAVVHAKSMRPVNIPSDGLPSWLGDPFHDYVVHFGLANSGSGLGAFVQMSFDIYEKSQQIYSAQPAPMVELADGSFGLTNESFLDRLTYHPWTDFLDGPASLMGMTAQGPVRANELWRVLTTPNESLDFWAAAAGIE